MEVWMCGLLAVKNNGIFTMSWNSCNALLGISGGAYAIVRLTNMK